MAAALRVILLLSALTGAVWSQDPAELVFCYTDRNCNTLTADPQLTRRQCCVETSASVGFQVEGDETCNICIVYGFFQSTFSASEQGEPYSLEVGYLKGREEGANLQLRADTEFGTANFTPPTATIRVFPILDEPATMQFNFRVDAIAQEPDETVTLVLVNLFDPNFGSNAFFLDRAELVIVDSDVVDIIFTEEDFRGPEEDRSAPVAVNKNRRIATPVVVEVTPVTLTQHRATGRPDPPGVETDSLFSPIEANLADFDNTVMVLTFQADETGIEVNDLDAPVPIVDDAIDEAREQNFVVSLRILNVTNPNGINVARQDSLVRLIDNDDIRIGFERPSYEFTEPEQFQEDVSNQVFLAKENGVVSEQTFQLVISVSETVPNGTFQPATHAAGNPRQDNDYEISSLTPVQLLVFPSGLQRIPFDFTLFPDDIAEGPEAFQAIPSQDSTPTFLQPLILSENTFILIEDNDRVFIGFETNYTVNETAGTVEVCAVVTFPADDVPITSRIFLSVNTIEGTATESDYERILASEGRVVLIFDNVRRRACFPLSIVDDDAFEDTESLTIDLAFFDTPSDSVVLDPDVTTVTILDDDEVVIGFIDPPYNVTENEGPAILPIGVLDGRLEREVVVLLSKSDGTAIAGSDYGAAEISITFAAGTTRFDQPVTIIDDEIFELTESFSAMLALPGGPIDRVTVNPDAAEVTIFDNDEIVFGFTPTDYTVNEGVTADLTVSFISGNLGAVGAGGLAVNVFTSSRDGTAVGGGTEIDYSTVVLFPINFNDDQRSGTASISTSNDQFVENDEYFFADLVGAQVLRGSDVLVLTQQEEGRITLQPDIANVTILDNDAATIGFLETAYRVGEGDGSVSFEIGVIDGFLRIDVPVTFQTEDNTAIDVDDYEARTEILTFNGVTTRLEVPVTIVDDNITENVEDFFGRLTAAGVLPPRVLLNPVEAIATIDDDDQITIGFDPDVYSVNEGDGSVTFTVRVISGSLDRDVVVEFTTQDGTAEEPGDYTTTTQLLTFSSTVSSVEVSVPIIDDDLVENVETFTGNLALGDPADATLVVLDPAVATASIVDNDVAVIGFDPDSYEVTEGIDGMANIGVRVISGTLQRDVVVQFDTADDTAVSVNGGDFVAVTGRLLTFNGGTTSQTVPVAILDDDAVEAREYFNATLVLVSTDATGVTVNPALARVAINDIDNATIGFDRAEYDVPEDAGTVNVTIRLTGTIAKDVVVTLTTGDGTAVSTGEADFTARSVDITFTPGGPSEFEIPITIIDDVFLEYMIEDFSSILTLTTAAASIEINPAEATINIIDNDDVVVGFDPATYSAREDDPSPPPIVVRVLRGELRRNVIVTFTSQEGTATAGVDYEAIPPMTFTFSQGNTMATIPVNIIDDDILERDESFTATLGTEDGSVILMPGSATYTIVNDDGVRFTFRQPMYMFIENSGTGIVCVDKVGQTDQTLTVMVSGPLQAETGMFVDRELTFAPEETFQCINFDIVDDSIALEDPESFTWRLDIVTVVPGVQLGAFNTTVITILDDDELVLNLEKSRLVPEAAGVARACITFSNPFARSFPIRLAASDPNTTMSSIATQFVDYIPPDFGLVANPEDGDVGEICYDAAVIIDDQLVEELEQCFEANFSIPEDIEMLSVENATAVCCIVDDDRVRIGFNPDSYSVAESTGEVFITVELLEGQLERAVEVDFLTRDGSATSVVPVDFIDPGRVVLQFDNTTTSVQVRVEIVDDDILENDENFFGNLETTDGSVDLGPQEAEVTILEDNDEPTVGFDPDSYIVNEADGTATLTVRLISGSLERDVTVFFETNPGTAGADQDYTTTTSLLTFSPGTSSVDVSVPILQDDIVESDETFFGQLDAQGQPVFTIPDLATVTITDDSDTVTIGFERTEYSVDEGDQVEVCVIVQSGMLERDAVVSTSSIDGSAIAGQDYDAIAGLQLTFSEDVSRRCFNVTSTEDGILEIDEIFTLDLDTDDGSVILNPEQATVQIIDDDPIQVGLEETVYSTPEGDVVVEVCTVVISGTLERDAVVTLQTEDGTANAGADYSSLSADLTFTPTTNRICQNVSILDDVIYENDETIRVFLETDDPDVTIVPDRSEGEITIVDNDEVTIGFEFPAYTVNEPGSSLEVCVILREGILERDVVVGASTADDTAEAPADYTATTVELTFNIGDTVGDPVTGNRCFDIPIINDDLFEGPEQFIGNLMTTEPRVTLDPERTEITILDDEAITIGFVQTPYSGIEGNEYATVYVGKMGMIQPGVNVVVELTTTDLTLADGVFPAIANVDYQPVAGLQLTFSSEVTLIGLNLTLIDDDIVEYDETFQANLALITTGTGVTLADDSENVLIIDDDRITIGLEETVIEVEEDIGVREVCASIMSGVTEREIEVTLTSRDNSAEAGADYEAVSYVLIFDGDTDQVCRNITIIDDDLYEGDETFNLDLTTDESFVDLVPDEAEVTILDDDMLVVGWVQELYEVNEGDGSATMCATVLDGMLATTLPGILVDFRDGSADSPDDYVRLADFQFVFSASAPGPLCVSLPIIDDDAVELPEDFFGDLSWFADVPDRVTINPVTTRVVISDNDPAVIGFLETDYTVDENDGPAVLRVGIISGTLETDVVVRLTTTDGTAVSTPPDPDYVSMVVELTFIGGTGTEQNPQVVIIDDTIDEPLLESFTATLERITNIDRVTVDPDEATVTIRDDDVVRITIEQPEYTVPENDSVTTEICVLVVDPPRLGRTVMININSADNTAVAPDDYVPVSSVLTFDADNLRRCVNVTGREDDVVDPDEDFTVVITDGPDVVFIRNMTTVRIEERENITVRFAQPEYNFTENGVTGTIEVIKIGVSDEPFQIRVIGGPSTQTDIVRSADGVNEVIQFEAGPGAPNSIFVNFALTDDDVGLEAIETYIASLQFANGAVPFVTIGSPDTTRINVFDDDVVTVGFGIDSVTVNEEDETFRMCVVKNRPTVGPVTVTIRSDDNTATSDEDYRPSTIPTTVTVEADSNMTCFNGDIIDDEIALEPIESFTLTITNIDDPRVVPGIVVTEIFIVDDDEVTVTFVQSKYTFSEDGGFATVCLVKDFETATTFTVDTFTLDGTAFDGLDYTGGTSTITFGTAAGDQQCRTITILPDNEREETEDFTVNLVDIANDNIELGDPSVTTVCIEDTGITVNDTVIGDPLFTVPILVSEDDLQQLNTSRISLCYEVHGEADQYFNLVTDECASVNAHYYAATSFLNVIDEIGVRAVDDAGQCKNILVTTANNCSAYINGVALTASRYSSNGIMVRKYPNRVRISVPNCNELTLVMWVFCETQTLDDPYAPEGRFTGDMIKYVVTRGLNFGHRQAHGLLGQFWNIPVSVSRFTGLDRNGEPAPGRYVIDYMSANSGERRNYTGWLYDLTWEFEEGPCLYVGNRQAGPIYEVRDPNDDVVEGVYQDYRVPSAFSEEEYGFGLFSEDRCAVSTAPPPVTPA